jgi:hypothetical protein
VCLRGGGVYVCYKSGFSRCINRGILIISRKVPEFSYSLEYPSLKGQDIG